MSQNDDANVPQPTDDAVPRARVLRTLYADAMREMLQDPRKAVVEHEPSLLALLPIPSVASRG